MPPLGQVGGLLGGFDGENHLSEFAYRSEEPTHSSGLSPRISGLMIQVVYSASSTPHADVGRALGGGVVSSWRRLLAPSPAAVPPGDGVVALPSATKQRVV